MTSPTKKKTADLKVIIMGSVCVGKTSFIHRYIEGHFKESIKTIGASFSLKQWGSYNIALWDTAGEERFRGLSEFYCRNADAAIFAFDITDEDSFHSLRAVFSPLLGSARDNCLCVVIGTKLDLVASKGRAVNSSDALTLARELNPTRDCQPYFETSSLTGDHVDVVFDFIFKTCLPQDKKSEQLNNASTINLNDQPAPAKSSCC